MKVNRLIDEEGPFKKRYFSYNEKVRIKNTGSDLDGEIVTVVGVATRHVLDTYIVEFNSPKTYILDPDLGEETYKCVTLLESCLEKIYVNKVNLLENRLYVGQMGVGKTAAVNRDAFDFIVQKGGFVIVFDTIKSGIESTKVLESKFYRNYSGIKEIDFLLKVENILNHYENFSKPDRAIFGKLPHILIVVEHINFIEHKEKFMELIRRSFRTSYQNKVIFSGTSQMGDSVALKGIQLRNFSINLFKIGKEQAKLLGNEKAATLRSEAKGYCYIDGLLRKYIEVTPEEKELLSKKVFVDEHYFVKEVLNEEDI